MNTITLRVDGAGWMAQWSGPHAKKVVRLFGQDTLPLPFTADAVPSVVCDTIRQLNPDVRIICHSTVFEPFAGLEVSR